MASIRVEILDGELSGTCFTLSGISILGRDPACSVHLPDRSVSREHALIRQEPGVGFVVEDLDSRSGTFVNGARKRKSLLVPGDTIRVGAVALRVYRAIAPGEVPPEEVEVVKTRHMPTMRYSLDAVRSRKSARFLRESAAKVLRAKDSGSSLPTLGELPALHETPAAPAPAGKGDGEAARRLELILDIANALSVIREPGRLTREAASRLFACFPQARRIGFFELTEDPRGGEDPVLRPTYLVDRSQREQGHRVVVSRAVLFEALRTRHAILSEDVMADPRFAVSESLSNAGVCSILCAPLCLEKRLLGALYVDCTDPQNLFDDAALRLVTGVASIVAAALENARLFSHLEAERRLLKSVEDFVHPHVARRISDGDLAKQREGMRRQGTFAFVDVCGFTRLTLSTEAKVLVETLNEYFTAMVQIIDKRQGTVERFVGDSVLAYWGVLDDDPIAPVHAIRAALAMQVEVVRLSHELAAAGRPRLQVAVGLNTGEVIAGDVGSYKRSEFTVFGDAVNMAQRYQSLADAEEIIAGIDTVRAVGARVLQLALPPTRVKGKDQPVQLAAVYGLRVDEGYDSERLFELAVPARVDLGHGPEDTVASGLDIRDGDVSLEVLTRHDPQPGGPAQLVLRVPRGEETHRLAGRVRPAANDDTLFLRQPNLAAGLLGMQRIRLNVADGAALLRYLRVPVQA